jgi:bifunctional non-homologous end joining protein LigD
MSGDEHSNLRFQLPKRARPVALPGFVQPMLAAPADGKFNLKGWIFEPKLDGMRALTVIRNGEARMYSRRGLEITNQYPKLAQQMPHVCPQDAIVDGEIIALDAARRPSFQQLQQRMNLTKSADIAKIEQIVPAYYFVFDVLELGGFDLTAVPLRERKSVLSQALVVNDQVRILDYFDDDGELAYDACIENGFEGIVAKRLEGLYEIGRRSPSWIKVKAQRTEDFVICGYTPGQGSRGPTFGALLLGVYDDTGSLVYCGSVGSGFDNRLLDELVSVMTPLKTKKSSLVKPPADKKDVVWLAPTLVAEIKFMDRTRDGHLRAPVFLRLRDELVAAEITMPPVPLVREQIVAEYEVALRPQSDQEKNSILEQLDQKAANLELEVAGRKIKLTNLDRELWRSGSRVFPVTKRQYLRYLVAVSSLILSHLQGRPLTLIRSRGFGKEPGFYQKHWQDLPEFVDTGYSSDGQLLFCNNLPSLIWFGQHKVLEFHTWTARVKGDAAKYGGTIADETLSKPDFLVIDIDVHSETDTDTINGDSFLRARDAAFILKEACSAVFAEAFVKTSGNSGVHIFIPIERKLEYDSVRLLANTICAFTASKKPDHLSIELQPAKRGTRVLLDSGSNIRNRTVCAPYSMRANMQGAVSTPVTWGELAICQPGDFTVISLAERIATKGDVWSNIFARTVDLQALIEGPNRLI